MGTVWFYSKGQCEGEVRSVVQAGAALTCALVQPADNDEQPTLLQFSVEVPGIQW